LYLRIIALAATVLLSPQLCNSQVPEFTNKQLRKNRPEYLQLGLGLNKGSMRDFATSPITYKGVLFNCSVGYMKMDTTRETRFTTRFNHGSYRYIKEDGIPLTSRTSMY